VKFQLHENGASRVVRQLTGSLTPTTAYI